MKNNRIAADMHTHICRSTFDDMMASAEEKGIRYFGLTEHAYQFQEMRSLYPDFFLEGTVYQLQEYRELLAGFKSEKVKILMGAEIDFLPGFTEDSVEVLNLDFDFIVGSLHEMDSWDIHHKREVTVQESWKLWEENIARQKDWINRKWFDVLGHPIRMAVTMKDFPPDFEAMLEGLVVCAKQNEMAVELNSRDMMIEPKKFDLLVRLCAKNAVDVAVGSDAHFPKDIGKDFDMIKDLMLRNGIQTYSIFSKREIKKISIA